MDIVTVLSTVILTATLATLILAIGSYTAFKVRERRAPNRASGNGEAAKTFFTRYRSLKVAARADGEPAAAT